MCAIVGTVILKPTVGDLALLRNVFIESMIRGKHATGISFLPHWSKDIVTVKESISADKFVAIHLTDDKLPNLINEDGNLYLIGHCRYSTSDLLYNQPINDEYTSIVHNGVITQEDPSEWESLYGYKCITKNDSELLLYATSPLDEFINSSMAVCELDRDNKSLGYYRNGKRPLYSTNLPNGILITSTEDITLRSGIMSKANQVPYGIYFNVLEDLTVKIIKSNLTVKDLQQPKLNE